MTEAAQHLEYSVFGILVEDSKTCPNKHAHMYRHACTVSMSIHSPFILVYFVLFLAAARPTCPLLGSSKQLLPVVIEMGWHVH